MLNYDVIVVGELATNCYLIWDDDTKDCFIIDPGDDGQGLSDIIEMKKFKPIGILATHGHFDHVLAALDLKLIYGIPFYCSSKDQFLLNRQRESARYFLKRKVDVLNIKSIDVDLDQIEEIRLGSSVIKIIKTPGHTPGSITFWCPEERFLFTGDTLFRDGIGRTDFSYGRPLDLADSIQRLKELGQNVIILAGH